MALSDLTRSGSQVFGGRFNLINVLPGSLLAIFVTALVRSGAYAHGPVDLDRVLPKTFLSANTAVFFLLLLLIGLLSRPFQVALVQLVEGYWGSAGIIGGLATELHIRRKHTAVIKSRPSKRKERGISLSQAAFNARSSAKTNAVISHALRRLGSYPVEDSHVMPTLLGNILRNAEDTAGGRYGLDTVTMYPRLYPVLSERLATAIGQEFDQLDAAAGLCVTFIAATVAALPLVLRLDLWSLVPVGPALLALLAYRGALRTAQDHALLLAVAFDLHRFDLLTAMHLPLPQGANQEYDFNRRLTSTLLARGLLKRTRFDPRYVHPIGKTRALRVWWSGARSVRRRPNR